MFVAANHWNIVGSWDILRERIGHRRTRYICLIEWTSGISSVKLEINNIKITLFASLPKREEQS